MKQKNSVFTIEELRNRYEWLASSHFQMMPFGKSEFESLLNQADFKIYDNRQLLSVVDVCAWVRNYSGEIAYKSQYYFNQYLLKNKLTDSQGYKNLLSNDLIKWIDSKFSNDFYNFEMDYSGNYVSQSEYLTFNKMQTLEMLKLVHPETNLLSEIKGMVASKTSGIIRGRVVKITKVEDFNKFEAGNVLVTTMTTPDYLFLMKNSIAIVTDQGGLTCHAAIVARELAIPTLIGTRKATKLLETGDQVEIDFDLGQVKKLGV